MGDIVCLQSYRASRGAQTAPVPAATGAPAGGVAQACRGMQSGLRQMRAAARLLAEAGAELRDLARWDAEQAAAEARPDIAILR